MATGKVRDFTEMEWKIIMEQEASIERLTRKIAMFEGLDAEARIAKAEKLSAGQAAGAEAMMQALMKLRDSVLVTKDLAKPEAQIKIALERIEAVALKVEAIQKDQVTMADLKALEQRLMAAFGKKH